MCISGGFSDGISVSCDGLNDEVVRAGVADGWSCLELHKRDVCGSNPIPPLLSLPGEFLNECQAMIFHNSLFTLEQQNGCHLNLLRSTTSPASHNNRITRSSKCHLSAEKNASQAPPNPPNQTTWTIPKRLPSPLYDFRPPKN